MENKKRRLTLLIALMLVLISVPLIMVIKNESHLSNKDADYKFRIRPIDPSDPIRGKYIQLYFVADRTIDVEEKYKKGESVYVIVEKDAEGWAYFESVSRTVPPQANYFSTAIRRGSRNSVKIEIPFDRYFLNEDLAPIGESEYDNIARENEDSFYALVTIKNGTALLKEVYYKDQPYREYLRKIVDTAELSLR